MIKITDAGQIGKLKLFSDMVVELDHVQVRHTRIDTTDKACPTLYARLRFGRVVGGAFEPASVNECKEISLNDFEGRSTDVAGANYPACPHVADILAAAPVAGVASYKQVGLALEAHLVNGKCGQCKSAGYLIGGSVVLPA